VRGQFSRTARQVADSNSKWRDARPVNSEVLDRLAYCIGTNSCGPGEETVILLASFHFSGSVVSEILYFSDLTRSRPERLGVRRGHLGRFYDRGVPDAQHHPSLHLWPHGHPHDLPGHA
jgi:hypothetical protein